MWRDCSRCIQKTVILQMLLQKNLLVSWILNSKLFCSYYLPLPDCFLLVPSVSKNRMGVGAFFQVLLLWNQHQFGFRRQTLLLLLRLSLSLSFSVKHLVKAGSGDPEASLGYATIGLGSWYFPWCTKHFLSLTSLCFYTTLHKSVVIINLLLILLPVFCPYSCPSLNLVLLEVSSY